MALGEALRPEQASSSAAFEAAHLDLDIWADADIQTRPPSDQLSASRRNRRGDRGPTTSTEDWARSDRQWEWSEGTRDSYGCDRHPELRR
jgi:hypothetical protein